MDGDDKIHCSDCNQKQITTKQIHVSRPSEILIIQLNRFKDFPNGKDRTDVVFPLRIQLPAFVAPWIDEETLPVYSLYAVSNHIESIVNSEGHYTSTCNITSELHESGWTVFNDEKTVQTNPVTLDHTRLSTFIPTGKMNIFINDSNTFNIPVQCHDTFS